jgi:hypothetical protein
VGEADRLSLGVPGSLVGVVSLVPSNSTMTCTLPLRTADECLSRHLRNDDVRVAYALIATERFNQTLVALAGATAMFFLPVINSVEVFYSRDTCPSVWAAFSTTCRMPPR